MSNSVQGTCFAMCPDKERSMREKEGLLHILELDQGTECHTRPKADPSKTVKCFVRPAVGSGMTDLSSLRPGPVLLMTLKYLLETVAMRTDVSWTLVYEFIFDRLRAIRQDVVIQRIGPSTSVRLYEPIIRFHVYASERMCEKSLQEYVPKFNDQHLLECMKILLVIYEERDERCGKTSDLADGMNDLMAADNRSQMEALYILLYLGDVTVLTRALTLPTDYRESKYVKTALQISRAWYLRNYVRSCRLIRGLPPLLSFAALTNLPTIKRCALKIMSCGYNSQSLTYPASKLLEILRYVDIRKLRQDCDRFGLTVVDDNVLFQKAKFNDEIATALPEQHFKETLLNKLLPAIFFD